MGILKGLLDEGLVQAGDAVAGAGLRGITQWRRGRWITHGVDGQRLEAVKVGGRWMSTVAAVERFIERLNAGGERGAPTGRFVCLSPVDDRIPFGMAI